MAPPSGKGAPPALPPRQLTISTTADCDEDEPPPPYDPVAASTSVTSWPTSDPRSSFTQSLLPAESPGVATSSSGHTTGFTRRKLLLIYIHGFMGNETSFRSFPAHVHNLLTVLLTDSHVVHSKIYPRYHSKRHIRFARDDFSTWLQPHEGAMTDVILLGHSMGGLLSAEVAMMPTLASNHASPFQHRILGTINFDVPFLGMHPGIIKSGLASVFHKPEEPKDKWFTPAEEPGTNSVTSDENQTNGTAFTTAAWTTSSSSSTLPHHGSSSLSSRAQSTQSDPLWTPEHEDPNFNPSFINDVVRPIRTSWRNALHFVSKHPHGLLQASRKLVQSHLEFGGAMANYGELKARYLKIRGLEVEDERVRTGVLMRDLGDANSMRTPRVRFVNYYTVCTGRPKPAVPESEAEIEEGQEAIDDEPEEQYLSDGESEKIGDPSRSSFESLLTEATLGTTDYAQTLVDEDLSQAAEPLSIGNNPSSDGTLESNITAFPEHPDSRSILENELSHGPSPSTLTQSSPYTITPLPPHPAPLDVSFIQDSGTRKLVEKEHERAIKAYERAVRDRDRLLRDRAKFELKQHRKASKSQVKAQRKHEKAGVKATEDEEHVLGGVPDNDEEVTRKLSHDEEKLRRKQSEDEDKARAKAAHDLAKKTAKEQKFQQKEMTHQQKETLRLKKERQRMEAEAGRLGGEKAPEKAPAMENDSFDHSLDGNTMPEPTIQDDLVLPQTSIDSAAQPAPSTEAEAPEPKGPPKERTFCVLPPKDSAGERDPCWIRVFMKDVDEVGAHCGLFFIDERYERLVGETAERIESWVKEYQPLRKVGKKDL